MITPSQQSILQKDLPLMAALGFSQNSNIVPPTRLSQRGRKDLGKENTDRTVKPGKFVEENMLEEGASQASHANSKKRAWS